MRRTARQPRHRRGVTLLEVMAAVTLSATMMTSSFVVMRSSYAAWQAREADFETAIGATAVLRHFVQHTRQAVEVTAISQPTDTSGGVTIRSPNGALLSWAHNGDEVTLSVNGGTPQRIARGVSALTFSGFSADGVTQATEPDSVQLIRAEVSTADPIGGVRTISCYTWVRSW